MIVICTNCQAKFRVPDDRIGPRGAKVRCSRCRTVFAIQAPAPAPAAPAAAVDLEPRTPAQPFARPGPQRPPPLPSARADDPFASVLAAAPPASAAPAADPFAAPASDPFAAPVADPFAAPAREPDPFAGADAADPFGADPFAAAAAPAAPAARGLAVTDLSHLLGAAASAAPAPELPAAGAPPPAAPSFDDSPDGLALEERTTPTPLAAAAASDPFAAGPEAFDPGAFDLGGSAGSLELAGPSPVAAEAAPAPEPARAPEPEPAASPAPPAPRPDRAAAAQPPAPEAPAVAGARFPGGRGSRVRSAIVNAVALAALLVVALAMIAVWRTDGPLEPAALRPAAILAALAGRAGPAGPFAPQELRSGLYERERGPPLLFVRGKVLSRAPAPVAAVTVTVEIVRGAEVIARGEALAGAVPTPEELFLSADAAALAAVADAARTRAPEVVRPGDAVPFLVAIADHPADLQGAAVRVSFVPAGGAAAPAP